MKKDLRGTLAMMLAVMMLFSLVPTMAFAETGSNQITGPEVEPTLKMNLSPIGATTTYKLGTNVTGTLDTTTKVLTISGTGLMTNYTSSNSSPLEAAKNNIATIVIESGVTNIGDRTFYGLTNLKTIKIPTSVTSIGEFAFYRCSALESISLPTSATTIKNYAFYYCSMLKEIIIPNSVTSMGTHAFANCDKLTSVSISNSLKSISNYAFNECTNLTSVEIPTSVTSIGERTFYRCTSLKTITLPDSVTSIKSTAFGQCLSLTSIKLPNSLTTISSFMLYRCTSLKTITLPNSVTSIETYAFEGCTSLTSITIPNSVTSIGTNTFEGCTSLMSISLPTSITSIEKMLFFNCSKLTSVTIPTSVTKIADSAFGKCTGLTSITIPAAVTSIGSYVFSGCSGLTSIKNLCTGKQTVYSDSLNTGSTGEKSVMAYLSNTNFIDKAKAAGYDVHPLDPLSSIAITTAPTKTTYIEGENFDTTGMVLTATYTNGKTAVVKGTAVNGSNLSSGKTSVTISYTANGTTKTTTQPITVTAKKLTSIAITTAPTKTIYGEGENFDIAGMVITATYSNGITKTVNGTVVNGDKLTAKTNSVTISYTEGGITKAATQTIIVNARILSSIAITKPPTKTVYVEGENFDAAGMILTATHTDGSTAVVTGTITSGTSLVKGATAVTVSYTKDGITKTVTQPITVVPKEKVLASIAITTTPSKTTYFEGENFDLTGMVLTATYGNGNTSAVIGTVENGKNLVIGTNSITISYTEGGVTKTTIQSITVTERTLSSIAITTVPIKTVYIEGENFDATGMVVTATYIDGSTAVVTGVVTDGAALANETTSVTVSYTKNSITKTVTQPITVTVKSLESIAITTAPTKTVYFEGENFDATGMVVTANYNNGKNGIVTGTVTNGTNLTVGTNSITISFIESGITKTTTQPITIIAKDAKITNYILGDNVVGKFYDDTGVLIISGTGPTNKNFAFSFNKNIKNVIVKEGVTSLCRGTFNQCSNLEFVTLANSVTSIEFSAFNECTALVSINMPNSLKYVGVDAFNNCYKLSSPLVFPSTLQKIGGSAFAKCSSLTSIEFIDCTVEIEIGAFKNCTNLTSVDLGNVSSLAGDSFYNCRSLEEINLGKNLKTISNNVFFGCVSLTSIVIPDSVTSMHSQVFRECTNLSSITLGSGIDRLDGYTFYDCTNLKTIINPYSGTQRMGTNTFYNAGANVAIKTAYAYSVNSNFITSAKASGYNIEYLETVGLKSIAITTAPTKIVYAEGENFDSTGMVVTATYNNGNTAIITGTVDNGNNLTARTNSITISYVENGITKTTTQPITVISKGLASIAITTAPTKTAYIEGENFDPTGMVITATYNDGTTAIVTGTVTNGDYLVANYVTISYTAGGITKTATQALSVTPKTLSSIAITTAPTKIVYVEGENFDATGMIVTATYTDGSTSVVKGTITSGNSLKKGAIAVTVSYTKNGITKLATQPITVTAKTLTSLTITTAPTKTSYVEGESFNTAGMIITATYMNGTTAEVTGTVVDGNNLTIGKNSVTISYLENGIIYKTIQPITVTAKELTSIAITTASTKKAYFEGEKFDSKGMVVTATYNNGTTAVVTGTVANGNNLTVGTNSVTISYIEKGITKTTTQPITIVPIANATTTSYALGTNVTGKFDAITGVLTVSGTGAMKDYPDGSTSSPIHDIRKSIKYVVVESGVTTIGRYAFNSCVNLSAVIIPNSVTVIGTSSFDRDKSLSSINLGSSITDIGDGAFRDCTALCSITFPNTLKTIRESAFSGCKGLTSLELPNTVTNIGIKGFAKSGLTSLVLPNSVAKLGDGCFERCENLESISFSSGIQYIPKNTLYNCKSLTSVTIPDGVISLGASAFNGCINLPSIVLPESIKEFQSECFANCPNLKSIENLSKIRQTIRDNAFKTAAKGNLKASGTSYNYFFKQAIITAGYSWEEVLYDEMVYTLGPSITGKIDKDGTLTVSGTGEMTNFTNQYPIFYCNGFIKKIIISEGITNVGDYVFYRCSHNSRLSSIVIADSVTKINQHAFENASTDLVVIGKSVTTIDASAFANCRINTIKNLYKGEQTFGYKAFFQAAHNSGNFKSTAFLYPENTRFYNAVKWDFKTVYLTDSLTSLAVTTAPAKTVYLEGENFDPTGMVVTVTYNDGTTAIVDGTVTNGKNLSNETTSITISYTEDGITKTTTQPITVVAKELASIAITTAPAKTTYIVGQNFDASGMIVTATYSDGSTAVVTGVITGGTALANGATFVTVSYTKNNITKTAMQPITVNANQLSSIVITTAPTKTTYIEGENFDTKGMVVTATYNTGTTAIVTGTVADGNNLTAGKKSVTISYSEDGITKTVTQPITVATKKLTSITITTAPTKTTYIEGENFDTTGMVITATFNNGTTAVIVGSVVNGNNLAVGTTSVVISYTQAGIIKTINQPIVVTGKSISNTLLIDCVEGKDLFVPFRVVDTKNLKDTIFSLKYDVTNLEIIDIVSQTKAIETTPGIVAGSDIEILSYTPGEIKFKVNKTIASGKTWSGTVNIFKFKAKITGNTSVVAGYN